MARVCNIWPVGPVQSHWLHPVELRDFSSLLTVAGVWGGDSWCSGNGGLCLCPHSMIGSCTHATTRGVGRTPTHLRPRVIPAHGPRTLPTTDIWCLLPVLGLLGCRSHRARSGHVPSTYNSLVPNKQTDRQCHPPSPHQKFGRVNS